mmetsp:Transcript_36843/g.95419  ORF Transcript_36843/g.95419 Transcript_36843/m.95419 type:complete len:358 (-) Transcript_36843:918-1991(-)
MQMRYAFFFFFFFFASVFFWLDRFRCKEMRRLSMGGDDQDASEGSPLLPSASQRLSGGVEQDVESSGVEETGKKKKKKSWTADCCPVATTDKVGLVVSWVIGIAAFVAIVTVSITNGHNAANPLFSDDAIVLALLLTLIGGVFYASSFQNRIVQLFFQIVPSLFLCYFLPSLLGTAGVFSANVTKLGDVASNYFLPACLVLLTVSVDMKAIAKLGPKALIMFFTATAGIVLGGPFAVAVVGAINPAIVGGHNETAIWRGLACIAGSWIGGGANQLAMKEIFQVSDSLFSMVVVVDVVTSNLWLACLLIAVSKHAVIDRAFKANTKTIDALVVKMEAYQKSIERVSCFCFSVLGSWLS